MEPFGCAMAFVFCLRGQRHGFDQFVDFMLLSAFYVAGSDTSIMCL